MVLKETNEEVRLEKIFDYALDAYEAAGICKSLSKLPSVRDFLGKELLDEFNKTADKIREAAKKIFIIGKKLGPPLPIPPNPDPGKHKIRHQLIKLLKDILKNSLKGLNSTMQPSIQKDLDPDVRQVCIKNFEIIESECNQIFDTINSIDSRPIK